MRGRSTPAPHLMSFRTNFFDLREGGGPAVPQFRLRRLAITGDPATLQLLLALLDSADPEFAVVTPQPVSPSTGGHTWLTIAQPGPPLPTVLPWTPTKRHRRPRPTTTRPGLTLWGGVVRLRRSCNSGA